jgi:hypothetical protein
LLHLLLDARQSPPRRLCTAALLAAIVKEPQANAVRNRRHKGRELQREGHEDAKSEARCARVTCNLASRIVRAPYAVTQAMSRELSDIV